MVVGLTPSALISGAGGGGGGGDVGGPLPGRPREPASIVHGWRPGATPVESHVQETSGPVPVPCATSSPPLATVIVQGSALESLPVKEIGPPSVPSADGS